MTANRWPYELIDLSRPLNVATAVALFGDLVADGANPYFTDFTLEIASTHDDATAYSCVVRVPEHMGTHMDAPVHTVPGAAFLEDVSLHSVMGEAVVLDLDRAGLFEYGWGEKGGPNQPAWPAHMALLGNGVIIIEGLTNLERIRGRRMRFAALPPNIPGGSGFPVRAVAWLDQPRG